MLTKFFIGHYEVKRALERHTEVVGGGRLKWIITKRLIHSYEDHLGDLCVGGNIMLKLMLKHNRLLGCELDSGNVKW